MPNIPFVANHPDYVHPIPANHRVPMDKYGLLPVQLLYEGVVDKKDFFAPEPIDIKYIRPVHESDYLQRALDLQLTHKEIKRIGYPYNQHFITRELRILQGTLQGAEIALKIGAAFNVAGGTHHAGSDFGEGFCMFNDVAVAAHHLLKSKGIQKILVVDLDVHQGNGTAEILREEKRVFTFSMHGKNNFPFIKEHSDLDVGLEDHTEGREYLSRLEENLNRLFKEQQPEFVFYLAGADVLWNDKMGRLNLTKEDCRMRDRMVFEYCKQYRVPVQVGTAGGYSEVLGDIVDVHCQTFKEGIDTLFY